MNFSRSWLSHHWISTRFAVVYTHADTGNSKRRFTTMKKKIRYAVVGLGHLAQAAILPAFKNARKNSELVALVSNHETKRRKLAKHYKIEHVFDYADYDSC